MADWSITKAQYERNCFSKPLLNGRYEFILNRYAWREYDWMPLSLKSIFYNTSGSFYDNNEPLYSCLETWMTRTAHSQRGGFIWLWLECMEQEYLVNPQTTGFVLGEKTSLGTRKCTFVRFKEASVLADLLRSVWVWKGGIFRRFLEGCGFSMSWRNLVSWTEEEEENEGRFPASAQRNTRILVSFYWFSFGFLAGFWRLWVSPKGTSLVLCFVLFSFPFTQVLCNSRTSPFLVVDFSV